MDDLTAEQQIAITGWLSQNPNMWCGGVEIRTGRPWLDEIPLVWITASRCPILPEGVRMGEWEDRPDDGLRVRTAQWQPSPLFTVRLAEVSTAGMAA
ncbi:Uncharacterised protein [Acidipropionibacterium jensenii]|uniref:DUF2829 domain-containing protein n=1 Tax=Acidipropionibacterium jensenii TaxID=1749 RepID=A0A3S4USE6_9ACTN|nr:hypothetical protein [Acidipropionibacterium jensenii]VEI04143.1 Uncharacterised protein [Acidipropionibacterium jensenii]